MIYTDKTINNTIGFGDTNINVFMFGILPITEVFEYGGAGYFGDGKTVITTSFSKETGEAGYFDNKKTAATTSFTKESVTTYTNFSDKTK